jgi:HK97 family phage major capsid protein
MNRYERELKAIDEAKLKHAEAIRELYEKESKDPDYKLSEDERDQVIEHTKAIRVLDDQETEAKANLKTIEEVEDIGRKLGPAVSSIKDVHVGSEPHDRMFQHITKSLGEQFTDSDAYRQTVLRFKEAGGGPIATGAVPLEMKGTLGETAGSGGGAFISVPQVIPGVVDKLFQPLTFADLILSGQANTTSLRYVVEGTATSGAAGVAEGGSKPQSTLGLTTTDEPIKKIATSLKISDEMIEDVPAVQSYINGRLMLFVRIEEERQLLRGSSGGNEVQGILTSRGVPVYAGGTAAGNKAVQMFKAMNGLRGSAFIEPEWIVMHPTDWQDIRLLTDTAGQFFGGGPFLGPYGGPQGPVGASGQAGGPQDQLWNKAVYVTGAIGGAGTALVGTRANAQVWRRGGLSVEATNSNEDDFLKNLVAIRAEERLGLAVYRPTAYVEVRLA